MSQAAIRFVLDDPAVSLVIVGVKTPKQALENFNASELPSLSEVEKKKIIATLLG
jgi:aryl-alcohol dehydrogenase-like predicted oxidoreductase